MKYEIKSKDNVVCTIEPNGVANQRLTMELTDVAQKYMSALDIYRDSDEGVAGIEAVKEIEKAIQKAIEKEYD